MTMDRCREREYFGVLKSGRLKVDRMTSLILKRASASRPDGQWSGASTLLMVATSSATSTSSSSGLNP
jgi:hypothetical protein